MSDGALSQDEIDALMSGSSIGGLDMGGDSGPVNDDFTEQDKQAFLETVNSIIETQAATLSGMMGKAVTINPPSLEIVDGESVAAEMEGQFVRVNSSFTDGLQGYHSYIFKSEPAAVIAGLLSGLEQAELDDAALSAISEAVNTINGSALTALGDRLEKTITTEPAAAELMDLNSADIPKGNIVKLNYPIDIEDNPQTVYHELYDIKTAKTIAGAGRTGVSGDREGGFFNGNDGMQQQGGAPGGGGAMPSEMGGAGGMQQGTGTMGGGNQGFVNIQNVQFPSLSQGQAPGEQGNISLLMDVNMEMTVELGRTKKPIREILSMGEGTIIELDKLAGEPVDILVNHKLIANGEVVVIDENFGVRVTKIVSNASGFTDMT